MRWVFLALLMVLVGAPGCGKRKVAQFSEPSLTGTRPNVVLTPTTALVGKIISVNPTTRFAVLNFPINKLPALEQRMYVYRKGLKVGEVKVTGPQRDDNIVADITAGEAATGDEVRDR